MIANRPNKVGSSWLNLRLYPVVCLEGLRKTTKDLIQGIQCPGRDWNRVSHEYTSEELLLEPTYKVLCLLGHIALEEIKETRNLHMKCIY
jgi:hypothetical protein